MLNSQNNYLCLLEILINICKNYKENRIIKMDLKFISTYFLSCSNGSLLEPSMQEQLLDMVNV